VDYRIRRFGIASTALTVAIIYFILGVVIAPLFYLASINAPPGQSLPGLAFILGPFLYAVFGYVFAAIGCWLYNIIAGWTGGVALTLEPGEA
jgi:hypothetical protein